MRSGFSEKYETVGRPLQHKGFIKKLEKKQVVEGKCFAQNSVIRFNSEYMDVLGSWYFFKIAGILAFVILIIVGLFGLSLGIRIILSGESFGGWYYISLTSFIGLSCFILDLFHKSKNDLSIADYLYRRIFNNHA